jgi:hypothetical protein
MRELTMSEIGCVTGGTGVCTPDNTGGNEPNDYLGGERPGGVGEALISIYEGLVSATSHVIERVANAL